MVKLSKVSWERQVSASFIKLFVVENWERGDAHHFIRQEWQNILGISSPILVIDGRSRPDYFLNAGVAVSWSQVKQDPFGYTFPRHTDMKQSAGTSQQCQHPIWPSVYCCAQINSSSQSTGMSAQRCSIHSLALTVLARYVSSAVFTSVKVSGFSHYLRSCIFNYTTHTPQSSWTSIIFWETPSRIMVPSATGEIGFKQLLRFCC